jgi:hypothetical protein
MKIDFKGRSFELITLKNVFLNTTNGQTNFVNIVADTGTGKTRLIQELYHHISSFYDEYDYWPNVLEDTKHTMTIVPDYTKFEQEDTKNMPWLWLAVRCQNQDERNSNTKTDVVLAQLRKQIRLHLGALFESKIKKEQNIAVAKSLLSIVANYAFPGGGGAIVELVGQVVEQTDKGISTFDAIKSFGSKWKGIKSGNTNVYGKMMDYEIKSLVDQTIEVFSIIFNRRDKRLANVPIVFVIDDAQWIDELTLEFLRKIYQRGLQENWPLFIITTCWETSYKEQIFSKDEKENSFAVTVEELKTSSLQHRSNDPIITMPLRKLGNGDIVQILNEELPNINTKTKMFLAQNCSGDLELLWDYIDRVKFMLNKKGQLVADITKMNFSASKKKEIARERFIQLGQNIYYLLALGSAQGIRFSKTFLDKCRVTFEEDIDIYPEELLKTDNPYNITKIENNHIFNETAEFRRRIYYEVAREMLDSFGDKEKIMQLLIEFYEETIHSPSFLEFDSMEQTLVYEDFTSLIYNFSDRYKYEHVLLDISFKMMNLYLQNGFFDKCISTGDKILCSDSNLTEEQEKVLYYTLIHTACNAGLPQLEEKYITLYLQKVGNNESTDPQFLLHQSNYYFKYNIFKGIQCAAKAAKIAANTNVSLHFKSLVQIMRLNYYSGKVKKGFNVLDKIEKDFKSHLDNDYKLETSFHYTVSLLFDNADYNKQSIQRLTAAKKGFEALNDRFYYLLSCVCLAHAYMGVGNLVEAKIEIEKVYKETSAPHWINLHGVTAFVYANIEAMQSKDEKVTLLYQECVDVSRKIDFIFDVYSSNIWLNLWKAEQGNAGAFGQLITLAEQCEQKEYKYLAMLANTFALISAVELQTSLDVPLLTLKECFNRINNSYPGLFSQAIAAGFQLNILEPEEQEFYLKEMLFYTTNCEGIKGRPKVISDTVDILIDQNQLTENEISNFRTWAQEYPLIFQNLAQV